MENKSIEINDLLSKISKETLQNYTVVDFWEADLTAIGLKIENKLVYISSFNYDKNSKYNLIIEEYDTGKLINEEKESSYDELIEIISKM